MRIEAYQEELEDDVIEVLGGDGAAGTFRWAYLDNPNIWTEPFVSLGHKGNKLVGLRAAVPTVLLSAGTPIRAAQLSSSLSMAGGASRQEDLALGHALLADLESRGTQLVFATPSDAWPLELLEGLGFSRAFDMVRRALYLSYRGSSDGAEHSTLKPVQRVAKLARRLRQKLLEVSFEEAWLGYAERLFDLRAPEIDLGIRRDARYLAWRYGRHPSRQYRISILRRKAGVGLDAFVVWRVFVDEGKGRRRLELVDHWTRLGERRSTAWLLGELAVLGLAEEGASAIDAMAPQGSALEQALIASGCIRKISVCPFMVKQMGDEPSVIPGLSEARVQLRAGDLEQY